MKISQQETKVQRYSAPVTTFLDADLCLTVLCASLTLDPIGDNTDDIQWEN